MTIEWLATAADISGSYVSAPTPRTCSAASADGAEGQPTHLIHRPEGLRL